MTARWRSARCAWALLLAGFAGCASGVKVERVANWTVLQRGGYDFAVALPTEDIAHLNALLEFGHDKELFSVALRPTPDERAAGVQYVYLDISTRPDASSCRRIPGARSCMVDSEALRAAGYSLRVVVSERSSDDEYKVSTDRVARLQVMSSADALKPRRCGAADGVTNANVHE